MGMTRDEALNVWLPVIQMGVETMPECKEALDMAIGAMRKCQKIERILEVWHQDIYAKDFECIAEVAEVVEDGNVD